MAAHIRFLFECNINVILVIVSLEFHKDKSKWHHRWEEVNWFRIVAVHYDTRQFIWHLLSTCLRHPEGLLFTGVYPGPLQDIAAGICCSACAHNQPTRGPTTTIHPATKPGVLQQLHTHWNFSCLMDKVASFISINTASSRPQKWPKTMAAEPTAWFIINEGRVTRLLLA